MLFVFGHNAFLGGVSVLLSTKNNVRPIHLFMASKILRPIPGCNGCDSRKRKPRQSPRDVVCRCCCCCVVVVVVNF